eukprot:CCRYP_014016-RG/>CCRYP_014016-RG protein AED:0.47 eAED:1.00 QI:0/-1/0/1/-1/0/1/0/37
MPKPLTTNCWWHSAPSACNKQLQPRTRPQRSTNSLTT